jgi:hypothetical protein
MNFTQQNPLTLWGQQCWNPFWLTLSGHFHIVAFDWYKPNKFSNYNIGCGKKIFLIGNYWGNKRYGDVRNFIHHSF